MPADADVAGVAAHLVEGWLLASTGGHTSDPAPQFERGMPCASCQLTQALVDELAGRLTAMIARAAEPFGILVQLHAEATGRTGDQIRADVRTLLHAQAVLDGVDGTD